MSYKNEGNSGKKYQYDLSITSDKEAYSRDMDAQRRDKRYNPNLAGVKEG